jgi:multidrug efflux pump subunit AcrA (membrane-fusion protein)
VADLSQFRIELNVVETDIARVKVGQTARVTLDALSGVELAAHVAGVSPVGAATQGVVNYSVTIVLDETNPALRPGMTAAAAIVVDRRENVLLAPNRAIKSSGKNPDGSLRKFVTLLRDNQTITTTVSLGLTGDTYSEIVSGLQTGDTIIVPSTATTQQAGRGVMMVGGGPPGGFEP